MNTPEGNKNGRITVRRKLTNGLSIVALGVSSAMGVGGCSGIKEGKTYPQETQTQSTQGELTEQNTIMIPSRPTEGDYSPEQMERIQSGEFSDQENALENWTRYWGAAENGPFRPETKDLRYKYLFDAEGNCFVLLEASGEGREGKLFALPIKDGLFMAVPPETPSEGFDIPEGFGPLMLTGSVAYRDGGLVRLDENGNVSERLNLETARWEAIRFLSLVPETLELVEQKNLLRWNNLEEDLMELSEKENEIVIDSTKIEPFTTGIPKMDTEKLKAPSFITLNISNNGEQNPIVSVSYLDKGLWVLGIATKRPGSEEVGILHVAIDENAMKQIYETGGYDMEAYEKYSKMESVYPRIKNGEFSEISLGIILYRGSAEEGGAWDPLLSLQPEELDNDPTVSQPYFKHLGDLISAGHSTDGEAAEIFDYLGDYVLPCVSIGVIY